MKERLRRFHSPVGLRTVKTALAVSVAILLVEQYGTSAEELLFGVMGAFSAMEPTIKASVRSCAAQFSGVLVGVLLSLILGALEIPGVVAAGIGIILVMATYQLLHWKSSPVLPCLILVTICTNPGMNAVIYGLERIWNTALGLGAGMVINALIFPYDNSKKIQSLMVSLDEDLIRFLEDMFDGDDHLPEMLEMESKINLLERQLAMFADQRLPRRGRQRRLLTQLQSCEDTARALLIEVETLRGIVHVGKLNQENRAALRELGAKIADGDPNRRFTVEDLVVNYHVDKALKLREQLKNELSANKKG